MTGAVSSQVLCFDAYYTEPVYESSAEKERVRKCVIYFYLEDGTIQMVEHQQENSGIPQVRVVHARARSRL